MAVRCGLSYPIETVGWLNFFGSVPGNPVMSHTTVTCHGAAACVYLPEPLHAWLHGGAILHGPYGCTAAMGSLTPVPACN